MITRGKRKAQAGSQCLSLRYITKGSDLIPTSPLLQLEAGRNFETFIVEYLRLRALFKHSFHNHIIIVGMIIIVIMVKKGSQKHCSVITKIKKIVIV